MTKNFSRIPRGNGRRELCRKIYHAGLWCPTIHRDLKEYHQRCDVCQRVCKPNRRDNIPLQPQMTLEAFDKKAIDFVGPINPLAKRTRAKYIITMMKYLTRWVEAAPVKDCSAEKTAHFLFEQEITRFGCPRVFMSDQGTNFNIDGKRSKWIAKLLEIDLDIRPTKLAKGQGLAKLLPESNCSALGVNFIHSCSENQQADMNDKGPQVISTLDNSSWYKDIIFFLQNLQPPSGMEKNKVRALKLKSIKYFLVDKILYWKNPLGVLLICLYPQEAQDFMFDSHDSLCGGHHYWRTMAYKILRVGYFSPSLFIDVCANIRAWAKCQKFSRKQQLKSFPLKLVAASGPFQ
jgi:hypothetical protein